MQDKEVVDYARAVEATVYSIGFKGSGLRPRSPRGFLRKIATETGGQFFAPDKVGELIKVFNEISDGAQEPLPAGLHPEAGAGRQLARDRPSRSTARAPRSGSARATSP